MFVFFRSITVPVLLVVIMSLFSRCDSRETRQLVVTTTIDDGNGTQNKPLMWLLGPTSVDALSCDDVVTYSLRYKRVNVWIIVNQFEEKIGTLELMEEYIAVTLEDHLFTFKIKDDYVSN